MVLVSNFPAKVIRRLPGRGGNVQAGFLRLQVELLARKRKARAESEVTYFDVDPETLKRSLNPGEVSDVRLERGR